jgi:hypothetical protein
MSVLKTQPLTNSLTSGNQNSVNFSVFLNFILPKLLEACSLNVYGVFSKRNPNPKKRSTQFISFVKNLNN